MTERERVLRIALEWIVEHRGTDAEALRKIARAGLKMAAKVDAPEEVRP